MLDIKLIRNKTEFVRQALLKRRTSEDFDLDAIIALDDKRRALITTVEEAKARKNKLSKVKPTPEIIASLKEEGEKLKTTEQELATKEKELNQLLAALPNLPAEDVLAGGKENNRVLEKIAKPPKFSFPLLSHIDLAEKLALINYERATKIAGSGFWAYTGAGAHLEWALLSYFIDFHRQHGFQFILPPFMLSEDSAYTSGHLPKFRDDLFWTTDGLCLNATGEMMLGNYHRAEILNGAKLPLKYFAYSPCFRREGGGYRQEERGMIRGHQFNKVELFVYCRPEESPQILEELKNQVRKLVASLGLHFQISQLAAQDASDAMVKTYDVEVYLPSLEIYKEVSSISSAGDYQARRGQIRYKNEENKKEFVHTLNASGLATSRLFPAILEQFQQADGSVLVPKVLHKYLPDDLKIIRPPQDKIKI